MSFSVEGQTCPVCHAYLFDDDDVVICPQCGAPHHRDCYAHVGHCALEHLHGTPQQYTPPDSAHAAEDDTRIAEAPTDEHRYGQEQPQGNNTDVQICRRCHAEIPADAAVCPYCRAATPMSETMGLRPDAEVEGVTAKDIANFTLLNPGRYVVKFFTLSKKRMLSWNWAAFLFPCEWSLFRKNFRFGILAGVLMIAASLLTLPVQVALSPYITGMGTAAEFYRAISENIGSVGALPSALAVISLALQLAVRLFAGFFGDYFYRQRALDTIKSIRRDSPNAEYDFRKKGGVNILWFFVGMIALDYIPQIIFMLIR